MIYPKAKPTVLSSNSSKKIRVNLSVEDKITIANKINVENKTCVEVGLLYGISKSAAFKYAKHSRDLKPLYRASGAPPIIDSKASSVLVETLSGEKRIQIDSVELKVDFLDGIESTAKRRNKVPGKICNRSLNQNLKRWENKNNVRTLSAEETAPAREIACENIRNMVSTATAFKVQAEEVPSFLMFNFDATSSTVEDFVGPVKLFSKANLQKLK